MTTTPPSSTSQTQPLSSASVTSTPSSSVQPPDLSELHQHHHQFSIMNQDPNVSMGVMQPGEGVMDGDGQNVSMGKPDSSNKDGSKTKDKRERLSRACVACHTGKTRCSDSLPCQSCIKRGIANTCAYPDPMDAASHATQNDTNATPARRRSAHHTQQTPQTGVFTAQPQTPAHVRGFFYDQNGNITGQPPVGTTTTFQAQPPQPPLQPQAAQSMNGGMGPGTPASSSGMRREGSPTSVGRPSKKARYRAMNEQEIQSLTPKPYKRGLFFVGDSSPVSVDPRLPLRLLLADEVRVDFFVGDGYPTS